MTVQHAPDCEGGTWCGKEVEFTCEDCGGQFGACCGAHDEHPELCDDCASTRHVLSGRP